MIRGNRATDTEVIKRTLGIRHGDPLGQSRLYELESNLYRLGIFSRVDLDLIGSGLDTPERDLLVRAATPVDDPLETLIHRAQETPYFHDRRFRFVRSLVAQRAGISLARAWEIVHYYLD